MRPRSTSDSLNHFVSYLASKHNNCDRLPSLIEMSQELGMSVATLREQMEVARALGFVEVKPRTGIRHLDYTFRPAVQQSLSYAIEVNPNAFQSYSDLRNHIESAYWFDAVCLLNSGDHQQLNDLIKVAFEKLERSPIQIPHAEHRELHLTIYRRLNNPFVLGLLEAFWDVYEAEGLDIYTDIDYLQGVWGYHRKMVEAICQGNYESGYQALIAHVGLISQRTKTVSRQQFE